MPYTKEEKAAYHKKYYQANKEEKAAYHKKYYQANKEEKAAYNKKYRQSEAGKIKQWKQQGMISDDWHDVYETYMITTCCHYCDKEFGTGQDKHLDHDHDTGKIRGVLCRSCNRKDVFAD